MVVSWGLAPTLPDKDRRTAPTQGRAKIERAPTHGPGRRPADTEDAEVPRSPPRVSSEGVVTMALERIGSSERRLGAPRALERTASRSDGEQEDDKATGARAGLASPAQWKKTKLG